MSYKIMVIKKRLDSLTVNFCCRKIQSYGTCNYSKNVRGHEKSLQMLQLFTESKNMHQELLAALALHASAVINATIQCMYTAAGNYREPPFFLQIIISVTFPQIKWQESIGRPKKRFEASLFESKIYVDRQRR